MDLIGIMDDYSIFAHGTKNSLINKELRSVSKYLWFVGEESTSVTRSRRKVA